MGSISKVNCYLQPGLHSGLVVTNILSPIHFLQGVFINPAFIEPFGLTLIEVPSFYLVIYFQ